MTLGVSLRRRQTAYLVKKIEFEKLEHGIRQLPIDDLEFTIAKSSRITLVGHKALGAWRRWLRLTP